MVGKRRMNEVWRGRSVFITGHTGFKGSWLSHWLERLGAGVTGFSLEEPVSEPSLFELAGLATKLDAHLVGDVRDYAALSEALERSAPGVVFHLAAQPLVRESYRDPIATYATNVMG